MLATIYTKALRDRWLSTVVGAGTLAAFLLMGLAAYQQIDLAIYDELPDAIRSVMGIPDGADATILAFVAIYGSYGALTLAGIAISLGSSAIAGEERDGTIGLLLGYPRSRTDVLWSKGAALVTLAAVGALLVYVGGYASAAVLGVDLGDAHVGALIVHLLVNTLFYGFLAFAVGAWTGRRPVASGVAAGVMVLGFVGSGVLPLLERVEPAVRLLPWHYYNGSNPFLNGADVGDLAVLGVAILVLAGTAWVGVNRRDLRSSNGGTSLVDRLREQPLTRKVVDRLAGSARVSGIWIKTASEHQGVLLVLAVTMFGLMGVLMGVMYAAIEGTLAAMSQLPEALLAIAGGGDMSTPEGWFQLETFGLMAPGTAMGVTILIGSRALAGEEQRRTMSLLLGNPIRRSRIVLEKTATMVVYGLVVGAATFAGVALGSTVAGLGMDVGNIAATSFLSALVGILFGTVALALGAATGRTRVATFGAIGLALFAFLANSFLPLADSLAGWARWSPFHYYLGSDPLVNGMPWGDAGVLTALIVVLVAASVVLFQRRDLRQG